MHYGKKVAIDLYYYTISRIRWCNQAVTKQQAKCSKEQGSIGDSAGKKYTRREREREREALVVQAACHEAGVKCLFGVKANLHVFWVSVSVLIFIFKHIN